MADGTRLATPSSSGAMGPGAAGGPQQPGGSKPAEAKKPPPPEEVADRSTIMAILQFLRKNNLKQTEELLRREVNVTDSGDSQTDSEVSNVLSAYKSEGDPDTYSHAYSELKNFIESTLDIYRHELGMILYPVFVHMYLELVYNDHETQAAKFMGKFGKDQEEYYHEDIKKLSCVVKRDHMKGNELMENFKSSQFIVKMSRDTYTTLKRHLQEKKHSVVLNIIHDHLYLDVYEGVPRSKTQVEATSGSMIGEATRQDNKIKVFYGLLKEPDIPYLPIEEEDEGEGEGTTDKPKKKKAKKDSMFNKKQKNDPNAPLNNRMPLPELRDIDKIEKSKALREAAKRITMGPESLPSICFYSLLNASGLVTCVEICEDSTLMAVGFADSLVKVWSLVPQKLKSMKPADQLQDIDKEAEDVLVRMMDDRSSETSHTLLGHSGPVYRVSFSPDKTILLSCSEDATIRLWSLQLWTCLVCYKGHVFPVWDVCFSPHGYYFASAGHDKTARLWATDHHQPLRIFAGHFSDVDCVQFHPNSNYVASGSSDRSVRIWDCVSGACVRMMTGHKGVITCLVFSMEGRFLVSSGADCRILVWDLAHGHLLAELGGHGGTLQSMCFSRDGNVLASGNGGLDSCLKLWDFARLAEEVSLEDVNISHNPDVRRNPENFLLATYPTKTTPIFCLHFTRRNLLLGSGPFEG